MQIVGGHIGQKSHRPIHIVSRLKSSLMQFWNLNKREH